MKHENAINYYVDRITYYPGRVMSGELILGYAKKHDVSLSKAVDMLLNDVVKEMPEQERENLRHFARMEE